MKPKLLKPEWVQRFFDPVAAIGKGLEIFSGSGRLTTSCSGAGISMFRPFDIINGPEFDAFAKCIDKWIVTGLVLFVWMGPPCKSFSALRNWDLGGPLRPKGSPEGDESNEEVRIGNLLWRRALALAQLCYDHNVPFCIEHPVGSAAWRWGETQRIMQLPGVSKFRVDWCAYDFVEGVSTMKPTALMSNMPWLSNTLRRCPGDHAHAKHLRGAAASVAAAYPWAFCKAFASSYLRWGAAEASKL